MKEQILTDNSTEILKIVWDGTRFALTASRRFAGIPTSRAVVLLNPREMLDLIEFVGKNNGKV